MKDFTEFIKEYFWLPIFTTIIGMFLQHYGEKVVKKIKDRNKKKISEKMDTFLIAGEWNSFFREEKVLQTETVILEQIGSNITGVIKMKDREYLFTGEFKNQILVGTYISNNHKKDERGSIVLRYINEKLLSGYCTFVYKNKQVYNSPYVLTLKSEHQANKGTYSFCNGCIGKRNCCCNSKKIDMPILLPFEAEEIANQTKKNIDDFAIKLTNNLYQMRRVADDENNGCIFFQNNACTIYKNRPIDCRLFPFDFREIDGEYKVIYYDKICDFIPSNQDEINMCAYNLRPLLDLAMPYLSECCDPVFCERLKDQDFKELFPINDIRDDIK